jgi:hypothetical protein
MTGVRPCPQSDGCYPLLWHHSGVTPRILIGALINVTFIRLPFLCLFSTFRFPILLYKSCFVAELTVHGR